MSAILPALLEVPEGIAPSLEGYESSARTMRRNFNWMQGQDLNAATFWV